MIFETGLASSDKSHNATISGLSASPVYSPAVVTGNVSKMIFVSGQVALDPLSNTKDLVGAGDVALETKQTLENLKAVVEKSGSTMSEVIKGKYRLMEAL